MKGSNSRPSGVPLKSASGAMDLFPLDPQADRRGLSWQEGLSSLSLKINPHPPLSLSARSPLSLQAHCLLLQKAACPTTEHCPAATSFPLIPPFRLLS